MSKSLPLLIMLLVTAAVAGVKAFELTTNRTANHSWEEIDVTSEHAEDDPDEIVDMVHKSIKNSIMERDTSPSSCRTGNPIDDCWRCDPDWYNNRQRLADCAIGFGRNALGGRNGKIYIVTDPSDTDPVSPRPGTLRHAVIQFEPLWIIFDKDMNITLKHELIMNSYKTIDGRGANVHIANGGCITIQYVTNVIIHGLNIHHCKPTGDTMIRSSPTHYGRRGMIDGDAISIFGSSHIWIDHNSLSSCADGLIDVVKGSTAITISNNYMTDHDKVILLGHSDAYTPDKKMQVTIAYNIFGEGLVERMPMVRHGYAHVVNNDYHHWKMYAIGGSANPTINCQGNRFLAPNSQSAKQVTKILGSNSKGGNMRSQGDLFLNGAYFVPVGTHSPSVYARTSSMVAKPAQLVPRMTSSAGALICRKGRKCVPSD